MSNYENGEESKKLIVREAARLFYQHGYEETSIEDLCKEIHLQRSSIYYHFKTKAQILQAVIYLIDEDCQKAATDYCDIPDYQFLLGQAIWWYQFLHDTRFRKMILQWVKALGIHFEDRWVTDNDLSCYKQAALADLNPESIPRFSKAATFSMIIGVIIMAGENVEEYTAEELTEATFINRGLLCHLDLATITSLWQKILPYLKKLPFEEIFNSRVDVL